MESIWRANSNKTNYSKLEENKRTQVCVVGAGITGIMTAYELVLKGKKVILLDRDRCVSGATADTTAKVTSQHGLFYYYLIKEYGKEVAGKYLYSNEMAVKRVKEIINSNNIECDLESKDAYVYTNDEKELEKIKNEIEAVKSLAFDAEFCTETSLPFEILGAIKFKNQAQFNIMKYLQGILKILEDKGVEIYEQTKVVDVNKKNGKYNVITENEYYIQAEHVVLATHYPIMNFPGFHFLKMYQDRSYVIAGETKEPLPEGMYITSDSPTISFRTIKDGNKYLLAIGGSDHKTGDNTTFLDENYEYLEKYAKTLYPDFKVKYKWSTQDCISLDKIPYIGELSHLMPDVYIATGYKKWGMTSSHVAAQIICDKILKKPNQFEEVYSSLRFKPLKNRKEFGNMLKQSVYSLVLNKIKLPKDKLDDIELDNGGIIEYEGEKVGVYKDKKGEIFLIEPYCTHLGCELTWNNLEKSWDCPCHGSRFNYKGEAMNEPAVEDLPREE